MSVLSLRYLFVSMRIVALLLRGAIRPIEKLLSNGVPLRARPFHELVHRNPVGPGGSTVTADLMPRSIHVGTRHNRFHQHLWKRDTHRQRAVQGWLLERRRLGPSRSGY